VRSRVVCYGKRKMTKMMRELDDLKREKEVKKASGPTKPLTWEGPLEIIKYPDPRLRAKNAPITDFGENLQKLAEEMFQVMYDDDGCGLAAPQVGVNYRLMVFNPEGSRGKGKEMVLANPEIVSSGSESDWFREGCLSFPEIRGDVERPTKVKIKAQDVNGKDVEFQLDDFTARVFQHEYDHLQGMLFHDRMPDKEVAAIHDKLVKLEDDFVANNPSVADKIKRVGPKPEVKKPFGFF